MSVAAITFFPILLVTTFLISHSGYAVAQTSSRKGSKDAKLLKSFCGCLAGATFDVRTWQCHRFYWTPCAGNDEAACKMSIVVKSVSRSTCLESELITSWSSNEGKLYLQILQWIAGPSAYKVNGQFAQVNGSRELVRSPSYASQEWHLRAVPVRQNATVTQKSSTTSSTAASSATRVTQPTSQSQTNRRPSKLPVSTPLPLVNSADVSSSTEQKKPTTFFPSGCGKRDPFTFKIVGGTAASEYAWPWHVALTMETDTSCRPANEERSTFCGGTLINPYFVLTAAHCVTHRSFVVVAGDYDRRDCRNREVYATPANIITYGGRRNAARHDIALIQLSSPIYNISGIEYACLPPPRFTLPVGTKCMIYGWGRTSEKSRSGADIINEAEIELGAADDCSPAANETQICAGMLGKSRQDSCYGDSGGGLMCELPGSDDDSYSYSDVTESYADDSESYYEERDDRSDAPGSHWVLYGITSMGRGCGREPAIYQSVPAYSDWIMKTISDFEERRQHEQSDLSSFRRRSV